MWDVYLMFDFICYYQTEYFNVSYSTLELEGEEYVHPTPPAKPEPIPEPTPEPEPQPEEQKSEVEEPIVEP